MRGVAACEKLFTRLKVKPALRPMIGGALVGLLAILSPQVMSSGHGALHLTGIFKLPIATIALIFVLKAVASVISLGTGFRGGLFFASLLLGALGGQLFALGLAAVLPGLHVDPDTYAIIGMTRALRISKRNSSPSGPISTTRPPARRDRTRSSRLSRSDGGRSEAITTCRPASIKALSV